MRLSMDICNRHWWCHKTIRAVLRHWKATSASESRFSLQPIFLFFIFYLQKGSLFLPSRRISLAAAFSVGDERHRQIFTQAAQQTIHCRRENVLIEQKNSETTGFLSIDKICAEHCGPLPSSVFCFFSLCFSTTAIFLHCRAFFHRYKSFSSSHGNKLFVVIDSTSNWCCCYSYY